MKGQNKKGGAGVSAARPSREGGSLEEKAQAELHAARRVSARGMQEARAVRVSAGIAGVQRVPNGVGLAAILVAPLRVVEQVEDFPPEFETGVLADGEAFEGADVHVPAARQVQGVAPNVAKRESSGYRKRCRVKEQRPTCIGELGGGKAGMRIAD